jgi:hypothetical protein
MQLEIRASGGETCERCGSYELIHAGPTQDPIAVDVSEMVERSIREREQALLGELDGERVSILRLVAEELAATRLVVEELRIEVAKPRGLWAWLTRPFRRRRGA